MGRTAMDRHQPALGQTVRYLCCMNPTAGSFIVNQRLQRHFWTCAVPFPEQLLDGMVRLPRGTPGYPPRVPRGLSREAYGDTGVITVSI